MAITEFLKKTHQKIREFRGRVEKIKKEKEIEEERLAKAPAPKTLGEVMRIEIPSASILRFFWIALLFLAAIFFLYTIRNIILIFFVSLLFAAALDPMVDWLEKRKIPRALGVLILYLLLFIILGIFISNFIPLLASEVGDLALKIQGLITNIVNGNIKFPGFLDGFRPAIKEFFEGVDVSKIAGYQDFLMQFAQKLTSVGRNVFNAVIVTFNGLLNALLVLVLTFLMAVDEKSVDKFVLSLFPAKYAKYITEKSNLIKGKIGAWLRGQVMLSVVVGVLTYIGFSIIGLFTAKVDYAATLSMFAGLTEVIPVLGPIIAWFVSVPIVANQSFSLVLWVTILFIIVQQLENNFIVPLVMKKAVGLHPLLTLIAALIGFELLGILGIVLAIPVTTAVAIFFKDYAEKDK